MKNKILLVDCDGTICEDIPNEESHRYSTAKVYDDALKTLNEWYNQGAHITFFTAREEKDREVTTTWLDKHGFKYHGLIMGKPRATSEDSEYLWVDNRKVRGITYNGNWTELISTKKEILTFDD